MRAGSGPAPIRIAHAVGQEAQRHGAGSRGVQLTERPCRRIARIGESFLPEGIAPFIEGRKVGLEDDDLAAHFQTGGQLLALRRRSEPQGDILDGAHGGGHHFAGLPVAAGQGFGQDAVFIDDLQRQTVQLGVAPEGERRFGQGPAHALDEFAPFLRAEHIVQPVHAAAVRLLVQSAQKAAAHAQGGRMRAAPLGMGGFQRQQFAE